MEREDFFVYLMSDANSRQFSSNKTSGFTNLIRPGLALEGQYCVALENIIFDDKYIAIKKEDSDFSIQLKITEFSNDWQVTYRKIYNYTPKCDFVAKTEADVIAILNFELLCMIRENEITKQNETNELISIVDGRVRIKPINSYKYVNGNSAGFSCAWKLSDSWKKTLGLMPNSDESEILNESEENGWLGMVFQEESGVVHKSENNNFTQAVGLKFGQVGAGYYAYYNENMELVSAFAPKLPDSVPSIIYVYTDIVEPSYLGAQSVSLLDIIPRREIYSKNSTFSTFKHVSKCTIDSISTTLSDELGNPVPFAPDVNVTMVLHFKKVRLRAFPTRTHVL